MAEQVRPKKMSARAIARAVREAIVRRELHPGDRLREVELAERFGVSRGRVREALSSLESAGVVKIEHRRGATIRRLSDLETSDAVSLGTLIMGYAVEKAAERATAEERDALRTMGESLAADEATQSSYDFLQRVGELHRLIGVACHNPQLARMIDSHVMGGPSAMQAPAGLVGTKRRKAAAESWRALVTVVADGDSRGAGAQLRKIHARWRAAITPED